MKVLLLRGNPRKTGYTQLLTDLFVQGLREADADLTDVDLSDASIRPCLGCYHCWLATPGKCVHRDDMDRLIPLLCEADVVVCATPLYFYTMSSCLKTFFERTLPVMRHGFADTPMGCVRNNIRSPELWQKKTLIAIVVGVLKHPATFTAVIDTFRLIANGVDMQIGGLLIRPESYMLPFRHCRPKALKNVQLAFVRAGREAGGRGVLTAKTVKMASEPIAVDDEAFRLYSETYWAHATSMGAAGMVVGNVVPLVAKDVRILVRELVRGFNPEAARRVKALIQFDFPDLDRHYGISIEGGRCVLTESAHASPDLRITCNSDAWVRVFLGEMDARQALTARKILLEGDKSLFSRLPRLFPPPKV